MYTLFGTQGAGSAIIEAAFELAGIAYRQVDAASWEPGPGLDELTRLNPLRQIPTVQRPDGSILTESAAILIDLGLTHPEAQLLPADPSQRAQAIRGLVFIAANCYSAISVIDFPERWCADADADEAVKARIRAGSRARLHRHWEIFADQFGASATPYLSGSAPGALDLMAMIVSKWSGTRAHLQANRPGFYATLLRIEQHPALAPVLARHWPPQPPKS